MYAAISTLVANEKTVQDQGHQPLRIHKRAQQLLRWATVWP